MTRYVWRAGAFVDKRTGHSVAFDPDAPVTMPQVMRDIPEYRSPIDGRPITSRSARREDLIRNGCVEVDPPKKGTRRFKNAAWAKKHGLGMEL